MSQATALALIDEAAARYRAWKAVEKECEIASRTPRLERIAANNKCPKYVCNLPGFGLWLLYTKSPERCKNSAAEYIMTARRCRLSREADNWSHGMARHAGGAIAANLRIAGNFRRSALKMLNKQKEVR